MKEQNKTWQPIFYAFLFLIAVLVLFFIYTAKNKARIQEQNRIYAEDCARQMAERVESEFDNGQRRIQNSANLVSIGGNSSAVDAEMLQEIEKNTSFDAILYTDAEGVSLSSDGKTNDSSDRDYFARGMRGESGVETVDVARPTGKPMMVFYAPVYEDEKVVGMFLAMYFAEDYLRDMLSTTYFGEKAEVFLCTQKGEVIASSEGIFQGEDLLNSLTESGVIDAKTAGEARTVFTDGGEIALLCEEGCKTDNLCVVDLPDRKSVV